MFRAFEGVNPVLDAYNTGKKIAEADIMNKRYNKILFDGYKSLFQGLKINQKTRILLELQVVEQTQPSGFTGMGWTWINLFDFENNFINGIFSLPIY